MSVGVIWHKPLANGSAVNQLVWFEILAEIEGSLLRKRPNNWRAQASVCAAAWLVVCSLDTVTDILCDPRASWEGQVLDLGQVLVMQSMKLSRVQFGTSRFVEASHVG